MSKHSPFRSGPSPRYPLATIAAYGPDASHATKLVVSILARPGRAAPSTVRTWTTHAIDVRHDPVIAESVAEFLTEVRSKQTISYDRIIGCPHEEGIDYPLGRVCPHCPFWATIDRFTHEPIPAPTPTMTPDEILAALAADESGPPREALSSADGHQAALVTPLLDAIDRGIADPSGVSEEEASLFSYALYLLAKWREPRAYPSVIRWLSMPEEQPFEIGGDIVTQDGGRILAAVCDGNLDPIVALIRNSGADQYGRSAGVNALALLAAWAEIPRERILDILTWLVQEGLERKPSQVWDSIAADCADIEAISLFPAFRRLFDEGLLDPQSMHPSELDEVEAAPRGSVLEETRERYPPIDDVVEATGWWARNQEREITAHAAPIQRRVGRNEPCPCGSGKKFKKCCGA